jgi:hypothetical protein
MAELPEELVDEAARLTRAARAAEDGAEAAAARERREKLLAERGYLARERVEDGRATLVCYPEEWVDDDGLVDTERVADLSRAHERVLEGPGDGDWDDVDAYNRAVAERIATEHGPVHGANATAFADFMSNHYARRVDTATGRMCEEFLTEYFPRNAWPTDDQRAVVERSLQLIEEMAEADSTPFGRGDG